MVYCVENPNVKCNSFNNIFEPKEFWFGFWLCSWLFSAECALYLPAWRVMLLGHTVSIWAMVMFDWLFCFFVIYRHHPRKWVAVFFWLNYLILTVNLWGFSAKHQVKSTTDLSLDSSTLLKFTMLLLFEIHLCESNNIIHAWWLLSWLYMSSITLIGFLLYRFSFLESKTSLYLHLEFLNFTLLCQLFF